MAVYCGPFDGGSTAKIAARLANGFVARGVPTDLLVSDSRDPIAEPVENGVRLLSMGRMAAADRVARMAWYLRRHQPKAVLTHRIRENVLTLKAARLALTQTPVFVTVHGPLGARLDNIPGRKGPRRRAQVLRWYRRNRGIIAITEETAADLRSLLGADTHLRVIPNPIVTPTMHKAAAQAPDHPWFQGDGPPVLVFAGRLEVEKDLTTLLNAFAILRRTRHVRLLIIGEGELRPQVEAERARLGLDDCVDLPGWAANPYSYLARAALVVLSSVWDALPTVLIESLALGTPVVSTECGAGPREILDGGRYGPLVPPRDPQALARAMADTLAAPLPAAVLKAGGVRYEAQRNADLYLDFMLGPLGQDDRRGG